LGKEAACLMPSGTMANLASLMAHAPRGSSVIVGAESDIYLYEAAGAAVCGGVSYLSVPNQPDGTLALTDLAEAIPPDPEDPQFALPALVCLENTQNRCGGRILSDDYQTDVRRWANGHGLAVHLDGARIFNAAVAQGIPVSAVAAHADSVQFCLSKGLSAPIGSIVAGSGEFVARVRRIRKMLGGGMRPGGSANEAANLGISLHRAEWLEIAQLVIAEQESRSLEHDHRWLTSGPFARGSLRRRRIPPADDRARKEIASQRSAQRASRLALIKIPLSVTAAATTKRRPMRSSVRR
jgi:threonine aldolase